MVQHGKQLSSSSLHLPYAYFLIKLSFLIIPVSSTNLQALGACATPGRGVGDSRGSVAAGEGAPGAVMPLESWIPSL